MKERKRHIYKVMFLLVIGILFPFVLPGRAQSQVIGHDDRLSDFYDVTFQNIELGWQQVAGPDNSYIPMIRETATAFGINPADFACFLVADCTCRFAWPGGMPNEIPYGFVYSQTGICQIPPYMAVNEKLIAGNAIVNGARSRYRRYEESILQPEKGVDYWYLALSDEAYEAMKDPMINLRVSARYMRRVYDTALSLWQPDARDSIMLDYKNEVIPNQHVRWVDEYDWGKVRNYLRDNMLWHYSYEFNLTEFYPGYKDRISELNTMIAYSEYRTSPPFDGSWFFEAMYLVRETRRWMDTREDILKALEPMKSTEDYYLEYIEDYSFYQDEFEILNPQLSKQKQQDKKDSDKGKKDKESGESKERKPRKGY